MARETGTPEKSLIRQEDDHPCKYSVSLSFRFLVLTLAYSILLAFAAGSAVRNALVWNVKSSTRISSPSDSSKYLVDESVNQKISHEVPKMTLFAGSFGEETEKQNSNSMGRKNASGDERNEPCLVVERDEESTETTHVRDMIDESIIVESRHPTGQSLLVDIRHVERTFLTSEDRVARAMLELITESQLMILSSHCHTLSNEGVSCVVVLPKGHLFLRTRPNEGDLTLDFFSGVKHPLFPRLPDIRRLFGVTRIISYSEETVEPPMMKWSHKHRSRPQQDDRSHATHNVMDVDVTKKEHVDIDGVVDPQSNTSVAYHRILKDNSYGNTHLEYFEPDQRKALDRVGRSTAWTDVRTHEALVHPAMFAHTNPERVAVVGDSQGAVLREVLKHNTVEEVMLLRMNDARVQSTRKFLPSSSDCSDLVGSADWCTEDPRATVHDEDTWSRSLDRFGLENEESALDDDADPFDVIIIGPHETGDGANIAESPLKNETFIISLFGSLSEDGVVVFQLGSSPDLAAPPEGDCKKSRIRTMLIELISEAGFESMHVYEESGSSSGRNQLHLVAFKKYSTRYNWYFNPAQVELSIHKRITKTKLGESPLRYFDGSTMKLFRDPPKALESQYCKQIPRPGDCIHFRGFDPDLVDSGPGSFEVQQSGVGSRAGRGVFATTFIPKDTYISMEEQVNGVVFRAADTHIIDSVLESFGDDVELYSVAAYMDGYGCMYNTYGSTGWAVDSGKTTFVNHGCDGSYNTGFVYDSGVVETSASLEDYQKIQSIERGDSIYNPVAARHLRQSLFQYQALRDIEPGEELLCNYVEFVTQAKNWTEEVHFIKAMCDDTAMGEVYEYENSI